MAGRRGGLCVGPDGRRWIGGICGFSHFRFTVKFEGIQDRMGLVQPALVDKILLRLAQLRGVVRSKGEVWPLTWRVQGIGQSPLHEIVRPYPEVSRCSRSLSQRLVAKVKR